MKNTFDGPIRRLDTAKENIYELEDMSIETKTKKVKRKKTENG